MSSNDPANAGVPYHLIAKLYPDTRSWEIWKPSPESQQLEALAEIGSKRLVGCLPYLAPLFAVKSTAVISECARVVAQLMDEGVPESVSLLSQGLHRVVDYETGAAPALSQIKRDTVWNLTIPPQHQWAVFGLLSYHGNGWVREAALDRLGQLGDGREIPFLLYRANDWVEIVAKKARDQLHARIEERPIRQFSVHLPVIFQLRSRVRGHMTELQAELAARLSKEEQIEFLEEIAGQAAKPVFRRWVLSLASSSSNTRPEAAALSLRLQKDRDPIVRLIAWESTWRKEPDEKVLRDGVNDAWPTIRRRSLELLCVRPKDRHKELLVSALFDSSSMVRGTARYFLNKIGIANVAPIYRDHLASADNKTSAAIFGISETGNKDDTALLRPLLAHPRIAIRRAALLGIGHLDPTGFLPELKIALLDPSRGVSKSARQVLMKYADVLGREFLLDLLDEKHPLHVRQSAIWLIRALPKWNCIVMLLETTAMAPEFNDSIREEVKRWLYTYNRSWAEPTVDQLKTVKRLAVDRAHMLSPEIVGELQQIAASRRRTT
jgi:HEAT repeat protein